MGKQSQLELTLLERTSELFSAERTPGEFDPIDGEDYQVMFLHDGADSVALSSDSIPALVVVGEPTSPETYVIDVDSSENDLRYTVFRELAANGEAAAREQVGVVTDSPIFIGQGNSELAALRRVGSNLVVINTSRSGTHVVTGTEDDLEGAD